VTKRLSIVIPTVNRARLVGRAIESALAQTSPEIEVVVSDNGSTDETPAVIERYAARGIRTFRHPTTMPVARHGQFLLNEIRTEFVLFLSDDDYIEPSLAAGALSLFEHHPELSFLYTGCAVHYEEYQVPALVGPLVESGLEFLAAYYAGKRQVCWCACVTRSRDLQEVGPQPEDRIIGDMFFWTKLALRGPVGCVPEVLSHYILLRSQDDNISHGTPPATWARESRLLADEALTGARQAGADPDYLLRLRSYCRCYVARTAGNQFVWTRIRGTSLGCTWGWALRCVSYLSWSPTAWSRVVAALLLPRNILRRLLLNSAAKLAETRHASIQQADQTSVSSWRTTAGNQASRCE
jgi:glycosyltransferase involved in cell wall biosynthesis